MSHAKSFSISPTLRGKTYNLLSKYDPSDIAYTIGAAIFDKYNRVMANAGQAQPAERKKLMEQKEMLMKAVKRFLATAKSLKLLEMQY